MSAARKLKDVMCPGWQEKDSPSRGLAYASRVQLRPACFAA